jgi:hypothetical protein
MVKMLSITLSVIGILVSVSWFRSLKLIYEYIAGYDKFLLKIEKNDQHQFITYMSSYLNKIDSYGSVTKQEMLLPYTFAFM